MSASFVHCVCAIALLIRFSTRQDGSWHVCAGVRRRELKPLERTKPGHELSFRLEINTALVLIIIANYRQSTNRELHQSQYNPSDRPDVGGGRELVIDLKFLWIWIILRRFSTRGACTTHVFGISQRLVLSWDSEAKVAQLADWDSAIGFRKRCRQEYIAGLQVTVMISSQSSGAW